MAQNMYLGQPARHNQHELSRPRTSGPGYILSRTHVNLEDEIDIKKDKISEQKSAIKLLLDKVENLEKEAEEKGAKLERIKKQRNNCSKENHTMKNLIKKKNQKISAANLDLESLENEIERVKNISWYQKLFGKK